MTRPASAPRALRRPRRLRAAPCVLLEQGAFSSERHVIFVVIKQAICVMSVEALTREGSSRGVRFYKVQSGETLWDIDKKLGLRTGSWKEILKYNGMKNPWEVMAGQELKLPINRLRLESTGKPVRLTKQRPKHRKSETIVEYGDSIQDICARHGCSEEALSRVNKLHSSWIFEGQKLVIPRMKDRRKLKTGRRPIRTASVRRAEDSGHPARMRKWFTPQITEAASRYKLPASLIRAVIYEESRYQQNAGSPAGAWGLMQLMPDTADHVRCYDRLDPRENVMGGTRYLSELVDLFDNNLPVALAAYNAGPGNVWAGRYSTFPETMHYVNSVMRRMDRIRRHAREGSDGASALMPRRWKADMRRFRRQLPDTGGEPAWVTSLNRELNRPKRGGLFSFGIGRSNGGGFLQKEFPRLAIPSLPIRSAKPAEKAASVLPGSAPSTSKVAGFLGSFASLSLGQIDQQKGK